MISVNRYDYVEVFDGNSAEGKLLGRFCGNQVTVLPFYLLRVINKYMNRNDTDARELSLQQQHIVTHHNIMTIVILFHA